MKEEIDNIIENELNNVETSIKDIQDDSVIEDIKNLVDKQNETQKKEVEQRRKILEIFEKLKRMGINLEYNDKMTNEELEKILERVQI